MKRLALIISLGVALNQFASAEDNNPQKAAAAQKQHARPAVKVAGHPGQAHRVGVPPGNHGQFRAHPGGPINHGVAQANIHQQQFTPRTNVGVNPNAGVNNAANQNWQNKNGNGNQNWKNHVGQSRQINHGNWDRSHHDRSWYRSRYHRFARFGGGYYYWDSGFWYPAYGYDPYFSTYSYDAPVYSYNDLEPGQVIANVQAQLQRAGYYQGPLDGTFGPMTRQALLNYQADNGLEATGEIDEGTLGSMGLQ